jgi:hypothetical protein
MATTFQNLLKQGQKEGKDPRKSMDWFREKALAVRSVKPQNIINQAADVNRRGTINAGSIGKMYLFNYDPKHKETLPYYDMFPLVFPIELYKDGFLGINMHYLPPVARAQLMDALYDTINNKRFNETTQLQISYSILAGAGRYSSFVPCVKRYLFSHVRSQFLYVAPDEWDVALMLPIERFVGARKSTVQGLSMGKV